MKDTGGAGCTAVKGSGGRRTWDKAQATGKGVRQPGVHRVGVGGVKRVRGRRVVVRRRHDHDRGVGVLYAWSDAVEDLRLDAVAAGDDHQHVIAGDVARMACAGVDVTEDRAVEQGAPPVDGRVLLLAPPRGSSPGAVVPGGRPPEVVYIRVACRGMNGRPQHRAYLSGSRVVS